LLQIKGAKHLREQSATSAARNCILFGGWILQILGPLFSTKIKDGQFGGGPTKVKVGNSQNINVPMGMGPLLRPVSSWECGAMSEMLAPSRN
jgi:hypothetical protein